jgi:hypothetical protein
MQAAILDFENRVRLATVVADEPFLFYTGTGERYFTGTMAWSLKGFTRAIQKVSVKSVEFHNKRGDFANWAEKSLQDQVLAREFNEIRLARSEGEQLRNGIVKFTKKRLNDLRAEIQSATRYF